MKTLLRNKRNPEFAVINIVSRYTFQPSETVSITLPVIYNVVGKYDLSYGYAPASGTETEMFRVEDKDGQLAITDAPATPYVSKKAMVQWLRNELASAKNDLHKAQMEQAIKALEGAPAPADAAK